MEEEVKEVVQDVKDNLPKGTTYQDIVDRSRGAVSLSQVKKLFSFEDISFEQAEKVIKYSWLVIRASKNRVQKLKRYSKAV